MIEIEMHVAQRRVGEEGLPSVGMPTTYIIHAKQNVNA